MTLISESAVGLESIVGSVKDGLKFEEFLQKWKVDYIKKNIMVSTWK